MRSKVPETQTVSLGTVVPRDGMGSKVQGTQTATLPPLISTKIEHNFLNAETRLALLRRATRLTLHIEEC
jgi:hypothetical protein